MQLLARIFRKSTTVPQYVRLACVILLVLLSSNFLHQPAAVTAKTQTEPQADASMRSQKFQHITPAKSTKISGQIKEVAIGEQKVAAPTPTVPPPANANKQWGVATQVGEHTWTMNVADDTQMGSANDIFAALNAYRQQKGIGTLSWDDKLASYAQSRATSFASAGKLDSHAGFQDFMSHDGFGQHGFNSLGENSSFGYTLSGVHLIEWVYAGDKPHDDNQLNAGWSHVGVGVSGSSTDLIFGGRKR